MDLLNLVSTGGAAAYVRLVSDHEQQKPKSLQTFERRFYLRCNDNVLQTGRRVRLTIANDRIVQHAVPIQKYRAAADHIDSQRVWEAFSRG